MQQDLLEAVAWTIDSYSYWVRVRSLNHHQQFYTRDSGWADQSICRCLTLEVIRGQRQYYQGQRWQIPEPDLDRAYKELRTSDDGFRQRCLQLKPTPKDVNTLILRATYGTIDLRMEEDDDLITNHYKSK